MLRGEFCMQHTEQSRSVKPVASPAIDRYQPSMQSLAQRVFALPSLSLHGVVGPPHGSPLLFLHGVTRRWQDYGQLLPAFLDRWQVVALDHRGHGRSDRAPHAEYLLRNYADDVAAFLENHLPAPAVLFGHSLGALVAALVAARLPRRVRALVLEDPPATVLGPRIVESRFLLQFTGTRELLNQRHTVDSLAAALADLPVHRPSDGAVVRFRELRDLEALRFGAECLLQIDPAVLDPLITGRWLEGVDWFGALPQIECPVLLLRGEPACGGMLEATEAERILGLLRRGAQAHFPGSGHSIHFTNPTRTSQVVQDFLESFLVTPQNYQPSQP